MSLENSINNLTVAVETLTNILEKGSEVITVKNPVEVKAETLIQELTKGVSDVIEETEKVEQPKKKAPAKKTAAKAKAEITRSDVKDKLLELKDYTDGNEAVKEVLAALGANKLGEVAEDQFEEAIRLIEEAMK